MKKNIIFITWNHIYESRFLKLFRRRLPLSPYDVFTSWKQLFLIGLFFSGGWLVNYIILFVHYPALITEYQDNLLFSLILGGIGFVVFVPITIRIIKKTVDRPSKKQSGLNRLFLIDNQDDSFGRFQEDIIDSFRSTWVILLGSLPIILMYISDIYSTIVLHVADFNGIILEDINEFPLVLLWYLTIDPLWSSIIFTIILWLFFIHLTFVYKLQQIDDLDIRKKLKISLVEKSINQSSNLDQDNLPLLINFTRYSIQDFRKNSKPIATYSVYLTIIITISVLMLTLWMSVIAEILLFSAMSMFYILLCIVLLSAIFFSFLIPQRVLHNLMLDTKNHILLITEDFIQNAVLSRVQSTQAGTADNIISNDLDSLIREYEKLNATPTWAFDYKQITVWLIGIISLLISILQLFQS